MKLAVLLSVGRHPATGLPRAAQGDLSALALALSVPSAEVIGVHAGPLTDAVHDYGAYGLPGLVLLDSGGSDDAAERIAERVLQCGAMAVVAGDLGEQPGSQGLLPYAVASALGWPVVPDAIDLRQGDAGLEATARLDGSTQRRYRDAAQSLIIARRGNTDHMVRAWARRANLRIEPPASVATHDARPASPDQRMPHPSWTLPDSGACAAHRLATLRGEQTRKDARGGAQLLVHLSPERAAREILDFLGRHGMHFPHVQPKESD